MVAMTIRIKLCVLIVLAVSILCSCSNIEDNTTIYKSESIISTSKSEVTMVQPKEPQSNIIQSLKEDLAGNGKINEIYLLNDNNELKIKIDNSILTLGNIAVYAKEMFVVKIITSEDNNKYVAVYKYFFIGSASGEQDDLYLLNYNNEKSIDLLWSGNLPNYKYEYKNNKISVAFTDLNKVIEGDISNTVKRMEDQKARIEPLTINDFFNGSIKLVLTDVGAQDYNEDNYGEIITKHDVYNEQLYMYLSSIYTIWKVKNDEVYIYKSFIIDLHSYESRVISEIIENGYLSNDKLESLLNKDEGEKDYTTYINKLVQEEIINIQNSKITIK